MHTTEASELYCGADLHGNNVVLSLCDASGKRVFKRRVKANLNAVNEALDSYWLRIRTVAVESTYNWYWFVDGLRAQGRDVRLANPAKMEQYEGLKNTDDRSDAAWLAEQTRLGILPESYVYPKDTRSVRDALRRRQLFVRQRTKILLSLDSLFSRYGFESPCSEQLKKWGYPDIESLDLDDFSRLQVTTLLESVRNSDALAKQIEAEVLARVKPTVQYQRLQQLPGIGQTLSMVIALESGEFSRFASAGQYASYCRAVKSIRSSNGKKKGRNNGKNGNPYLAWAFIEAATFAVRYYPRIKSWYERKKQRRNVAVAKKALACKLAKATWHVMNGKDFDETMLFG
jgi:transposase